MATVGQLASFVGGRVVGDAQREIRGVADLASAGPLELSFLTSPKYKAQFLATRAGAVLVSEPRADAPTTLIVCPDPYLALARLAAQLHPPPTYAAGIASSACVDAEASIDPSATIRPGAVVEAAANVGPRSVIGAGAYLGPGAVVGADCLLHPGVHVLERCRLGDRVILHAGVVVGSDGFGYAPDASGRRHKVPQSGIVVLEDDVEIGANSTVDRATFGETRIGRGSKVDNLVQIAHNVVLGEDCVIVSQSGIAGSTKLGRRVIVGAQGGVVGHIRLHDDVVLGARAGVAASIEEPGIYSGTPAIPHRQWLKAAVAQKDVPELRRRLLALERRLSELERERQKR
jgi:UDP-3-O-[3-hydroxymyristoyl] glucosamine N-acyltransferase